MIDIMSISGELLISVPILEDAVVREELMSADYVQLSWNSDKGDILPLGSYVMYEGQKYSLLNPYSPAKVNDTEFKYTPKFDSKVIRWQKVNTPVYTYETDGKTVKSREFDWTFTGTPDDAMFMIQRAILHETGEEWIFSIDEGLPETITISSQSSSIWAVLSDIADQCKTEWWADKAVNRVHLGKCIRGASVRLEVGKNIRVPSVTSSNEECYTRFYAFGSTRNITQEDKVSNNSIINKRLSLDPVKYPHGYKDIKGHYENGVFVSDLLPEEVFPTSLYFEDVYPSSSLKIDDVRKRLRYRQDGDGNKVVIGGTEESPIYETYAIWYFQIPNFDFSEDLIIEGMSLSVHFKSGQLRGREFELVYHSDTRKVADALDVDADFEVHEGDYEIIFDEQSEGFIIPSVDYIIPKDDDEITLFNIDMPAEYLSSAYVDLENKLDEELERRNKDNNSYEFTSNPISFYEEGTNAELGQRVEFVNDGKVLETRVLMVEKHLDYSFDQKIRVGNNIIVGSRQQLRDEVREVGREVNSLHAQSNNAASIQRIHERNLMLSMGKFFAMQDTMKMLEGAIKGYSEAITPITVQTMAMMVGDESLQFRFTASRDNLSPISCPLSYGSEEKRLVAASSSLIHLTLGIDTITAKNVRTAADYHSWNLPAWDSEVLEDADKKYYVYARVEENGIQGTYVLSETPIDMRGEEGYFYLLVGILNAEINGVREFVTLYGFTEVLPSQVTTDYLTSADGNTWLDLVKGALHLNNMAGMSGTLDPSKGDKSIAAWFGGGMVDVELDTDMPNPASSVIRHDGTGYFAKGLFSWDDSTGINLGRGGIKINYDGSLDFGDDIRIGGTETLGSLLKIVSKLSSMWRLEGGVLKTNYDVLTNGQFAAAAVGTEGGGSVGAAYLSDLYDVSLGSLLSGDILSWNGSKWVNIKQSSIVPDLSAYATKTYVTNALVPYATKDNVTSALGGYLPLSGGTIDGSLQVVSQNGEINLYNKNKGNTGWLFYNGGSEWKVTDNSWQHDYALIHSGNIGSQSVAYASNAGTLGGVSLSNGSNTPWGTIPMITEYGWMDVGRQFEFHYDNTTGSDYSTVLRCAGNYGNSVILPSASGTLALTTDNVFSASYAGSLNEYEVLDFAAQGAATIRGWHNWGNPNETSFANYTHGIVATSLDGSVYHYLGFANAEANPRVRSFSYGADSGWKKLAFVDDNVASATKLETPRTIWGQSFDGTGNVSGFLYHNGVAFVSPSDGYTAFGSTARTTYIDGSGIWFNASGATNMLINTSGNVGIGTSNPQYPFDVNGNIGTRYGIVGYCEGTYSRWSLSHGSNTLYIQSGYTDGSSTNGTMMLSGVNTLNLEQLDVRANVASFNGSIVTNEITIGGVRIYVENGVLKINGNVLTLGQFASAVAAN